MTSRRSPGEGSVFQRPDGRWVGQLVVGRTERGGARRRTVYGRTKREALEKLQKARSEGPSTAGRRMTLGQLVTHWLTVRETAVRPSTTASYRRTLTNHAGALWDRPIVAIAPLDVEAHVAALRRDGTGARTAGYFVRLLRQVLRYAVTHRLLATNPADAVRAGGGDPPAALTPWSPAEAASFLAAVTNDRLEALWLLALGTGMRRGELLGLQWPDVDLDGSRLTVRHAWTIGPEGTELSAPKTRTSRRVIPLSPDLVAALEARRQAWTEERTVAGRIRRWRGGEFVFSSPTGKPISPDTLARRFRSACRAAGVRAIRIHDLRHTYATLALRAGVPVQVVSERLGHSRVSITMDRYVGILQEQRLSGALPLAELLGSEAALKQHSTLFSVFIIARVVIRYVTVPKSGTLWAALYNFILHASLPTPKLATPLGKVATAITAAAGGDAPPPTAPPPAAPAAA